MPLYQLDEDVPDIHPTAYVADSATVIGKVRLGESVSIWFGATLRGDTELISIGDRSNIQESSVLHTDRGFPLTVGKGVTVGHQAMLHGCTIGDGSLIGIQAVILNGAKIGRNCLVGAGALVTEGKEFPDNSLIIGSPAKAVRTLSDEQITALEMSAETYARRGAHFRQQLKRIG